MLNVFLYKVFLDRNLNKKYTKNYQIKKILIEISEMFNRVKKMSIYKILIDINFE